MKKQIILLLLISINLSALSQSPITEFQESISYINCNYVITEFYYVSSNNTDCDSVCWVFGDGNIRWKDNNLPVTHNYSEPGIYTVTLRIWKDGIETQIVKPDLITVYNPPEVNVTYTVSDSLLFAPLEVDFQNQTIPGDGDSLSFQWQIGYYSTPISYDTNFSYVFEEPSTYYIHMMVTDNNGCSLGYGEYIVVKDTLQANEFEYIISDCTYETEPQCEQGINYTLENDTLILFGQIVRNCCTNNTAVIFDEIDTIYIPTFEFGGTCDCSCIFCFEIVIPDFQRDSCVIVFDNQVIHVYSDTNIINKSNDIPSLLVLPNPFKEYIEIVSDELKIQELIIQVYDMNGHLIINTIQYKDRKIIDMSILTKGVYLINILNNNKVIYEEKIVKI